MGRERVPTGAQTERLMSLGTSGAVLVSSKRREWKSLIRWGWLKPVIGDPDENDYGYAGWAITADGLRALAAGMEKYGDHREWRRHHNAEGRSPEGPKGGVVYE